jgi:hypothetical protein
MKTGKSPKDDMLATMRSRMSLAVSAYGDSREAELDDLRFMAGSADNNYQWPSDVLSSRASTQGMSINARPCLTINKLPQHVRQVTNDQRQNRPTGKVIPSDDMADIEVAEVFNGMIRHIEYASDADVAYDTACDNQVTYGEGYIRLLTEYCDDDTFDQDIRIGRIRNSFSVYMDPMIQDPTGADAKWCFITQDITKDEYERQYPDASVRSIQEQGVGDPSLSQWLNENTVRIAEYFYVHYEPGTLNLYPDGLTAAAGSREDKVARLLFGQPKQSRQADRKTIKWVKTNGFDILQEQDWPGKWVPVIRVVGNEFEIDGELHISGLIRNAKDAQRMYNYWTSQEAEMLALAPKAPFIGYGGQFEGYEGQWKTANVNNWPYLEVNADATDALGNPLPLPQRAPPPLAQTGLIQAKMGASDDIKSTTGQYDSSLGATSNERSGKAILAREKQGDTGTYHYVDNLARAIRHVTRQCIDLIPKIYDTARIARIIGLDGEVSMARIDPTQPEPVRKIVDEEGNVIEKIYNPSVGKYDVVAVTGPAYATKRQEAAESMSQVLQGNPALWAVAGDLFVKNMDWPGAQEMADRLRKSIDPKLLADDDKSPELQAAEKQIEEMGSMLQQLQGALQNVEKSIEAQEMRTNQFLAQVKAYDAETKRIGIMQAGMTPEQIQDTIDGTIDAAMQTGDLAPQTLAPQQMQP